MSRHAAGNFDRLRVALSPTGRGSVAARLAGAVADAHRRGLRVTALVLVIDPARGWPDPVAAVRRWLKECGPRGYCLRADWPTPAEAKAAAEPPPVPHTPTRARGATRQITRPTRATCEPAAGVD